MNGIPKIVHFIFGMTPDFGGIPFGLVHYLSVKSAFVSIRPTRMYLYFAYAPDGYWWNEALPYITPVQVEAKSGVFGRRLNHYAHRADVLRLEILRDQGGIYLDLDVISLKSFDPLLSQDFVMGEEGINGRHGLCNAIILSCKNSKFIERWIDSYRDFDDTEWNRHSVKNPHKLAMKYPNEIHILDDRKFFWPMWYPEELERLFLSPDTDCSENFALHLWQHGSYDQYLKNLTKETIFSVDTAFNALVRRFLI